MGLLQYTYTRIPCCLPIRYISVRVRCFSDEWKVPGHRGGNFWCNIPVHPHVPCSSTQKGCNTSGIPISNRFPGLHSTSFGMYGATKGAYRKGDKCLYLLVWRSVILYKPPFNCPHYLIWSGNITI